MKDEKELILTDLISVDILQRLQDAFSETMGMAALTTDSDGIPVTQGSSFKECCNMCRASEIGHHRCEQCDIDGAIISRKYNRAYTYDCHAGLVDFAAPIISNGRVIGSFIGGQVFVRTPDIPKMRQTAVELGIDPDKFEEAIKKVPIVSRERVDKATNFLYVIASLLSNIAYKSYELHKSNLEIEKASHMKSDFLANMSHEIRTPMNAVIGLADLALRQEMSHTAREYIHQIKSSSKNLLVIINDILDFSKIESGKMDIIEVEYEPLSIIHDLSSIVNSRIGDKDIEFTMDIAPDIPKSLYGDSVRIHQIILNLLTNAVKFTKQGEVHFKMQYEQKDSDTVLMKVEIRDTGIGIRKEDLPKLFNSFQQVDSKRNRNIEGTGLGLAISQQLLRIMGGNISVASEYNMGTTFKFEIPQKVVDPTAIIPKLDKPVKAAVLFENPYIKSQLIRDLLRIGAEYIDLADDGSFEDMQMDYFIVGKMFFNDAIQDFVKNHPHIQCLVLVPFGSTEVIDLPNVRTISKPAYSLSLYNAMGIQGVDLDGDAVENDSFEFIAPEARVLIVDDNAVNLTVTTGLLEPLEMTTDTARSAAEAIDMIHSAKYDLIFMDHMMPEVDGVEATHIIRQLVPSYKDVPIIALTANAIGNAREMFIREGMNDFVAKPIDLKDIISKIRKWLPKEKLVLVKREKTEDSSETVVVSGQRGKFSSVDIKELNTLNALSLLGTEKLFWTVLKDYFEDIERKTNVILEHKAAERWRDYTIEVHSLKSTSRQIGADKIADTAAELEKAGHDGNIELINAKTAGMIEDCLELHEALKKYFEDSGEEEERFAEFEDILSMLEHMRDALDNFDTLQIDEVIEEMSKFKYSDENEEFFGKLKNSAAQSDMAGCLNIVDDWGKALMDPDSGSKIILGMLGSLQSAIDNFDILEIDGVVSQMSHHSFSGIEKDYFERMKASVEESNIEECSRIVSEWTEKVKNGK
ncbi:MAG: PocR ligand-binding domain-containing protein [Oscillospiraceae bacterium]|nr:PocR ligand-binding domain-containing protein [Oscillospiraceae bacterium]